MSSLLVTRPNHDETTDTLCQWAGQIVELSRRKSIKVFDLLGNRATRRNFLSYLHKRPKLIFINGHGNSECVTGFNNEPLLFVHDALELLNGSIMYARSCEAGKLLGARLVESDLSAFIGYKRKFFFFRSGEDDAHSLNDPYAKAFLEPSNRIVATLVKGHTVIESYERSQTEMWRNFRQMLVGQTFESRLMAPYLWSNITSQVVIGDKEARMIS